MPNPREATIDSTCKASLKLWEEKACKKHGWINCMHESSIGAKTALAITITLLDL